MCAPLENRSSIYIFSLFPSLCCFHCCCGPPLQIFCNFCVHSHSVALFFATVYRIFVRHLNFSWFVPVCYHHRSNVQNLIFVRNNCILYTTIIQKPRAVVTLSIKCLLKKKFLKRVAFCFSLVQPRIKFT